MAILSCTVNDYQLKLIEDYVSKNPEFKIIKNDFFKKQIRDIQIMYSSNVGLKELGSLINAKPKNKFINFLQKLWK